MARHRLVESSRLERGAIICFLWVRRGSNNSSSRLESAFAVEVRAWQRASRESVRDAKSAILAPGRNGAVVFLNELQRILLLGQNRVEMRENSGECLPGVGQNRSGWGGSLERKGIVARMVFGRRTSYAQHQRRPACRILSGPKYMP